MSDASDPTGTTPRPGVLGRLRRFLEPPVTPLVIGAIAFGLGTVAVVLRLLAPSALADLAGSGFDLRPIAIIGGGVALQAAQLGMRADRLADRQGSRVRSVGLVLGLLAVLLGSVLLVVGFIGWAQSL